jgi:predicted phage gp36 major capsid-like protein
MERDLMTSKPDPETVAQPTITLTPLTLPAKSPRPARNPEATPAKRAAPGRKPARPAAKAKAGATKSRTASKSAKSTGKATKPAVPAPARDAARLLEGLHSSWRSALEAHRLRVEGQFRVVQGSLTAPKRRATKDIEKLRTDVKVHLKPSKGRAKDLRRVEDALDKALSRLRGD